MKIKVNKETIFLRVVLGKHSTWMSKSVGINFRSSFFLSKSSLCMLFNSMS